MTRSVVRYVAAPAALLFVTPALAAAHPIGAHGGGFVAGFLHPFHGPDHVLAMLAVGLLAAVWGGRGAVGIPAAFVTLAAVGWAVGFAGVSLPHVEGVILASVLALGAMVALGRAVPLALVAPLLAAFGAAHGFAHGAELPGAAARAGAGLIAATTLLHAAGLGAGLALARVERRPALRYAGAAVAVAGAVLALT